MLHLSSPGFEVAGFAFVGVPSVNLGHNRALSWSATTNWADVVDIWDVALSADGQSLRLGGEAHAIVTEAQVIRVRQPDGSAAEVPFTLQYVPDQGVLLTEELLGIPMGLLTQDALLARWTGFAPNDDLELFLGFDRAEDLDGFVAAVELQDAGMMNWVGATAEGIRYHTASRVPVRSGAVRPNEILDGDDPGALWSGWLIQLDAWSPTADRMIPLLRQSIDRLGSDPDLAAWAGRADLLPALERLEGWESAIAARIGGGRPVPRLDVLPQRVHPRRRHQHPVRAGGGRQAPVHRQEADVAAATVQTLRLE